LHPVVTKKRGRSKARKIHPAAAVSGRGCQLKRDDVGGDSADKDVIGEVGADAPVTWSTMKAVCLCPLSGVSQNNPAEAEKEGEVVEPDIDRKWKLKTHENAEVISANAQAAGNKWRKTRGKPKAEEARPDTVVSRRGSWQKCDAGGGSVHHCPFGERGADDPVTQSRTEATNLCPESGVESQNNPAETEEEGLVVGTAIDSWKQKRKRKAQEITEGIAASAQGAVSHGSVRKSSLSAAAVLLSAGVENKRWRGKVRNDKDELGVEEQTAQVQDLATAVSPVDIENERSRRNSEDCVPAVQKSGRTTRSHSVAAAEILPIVTGNKVRKAEHVLPDGELPANLEVPRNDAPVTRSLRNRIVQVYSTVVEETHVGEKLEDKRKTGRPSTRRHQQLVSSVKEEQVAAPCDLPPLKQLMRNHPEGDELLSNAKLETKLCRLPVAKDLKIVHPLTFNTANTSVNDFVAKAEKKLGYTKRSSGDKRKNAGVSLYGDSGSKAPAAKMELGVHDERTTCMHESVGGEEFQSAKGGDVGKQPAIRGPVRRSTRRCVVVGQI